MSQQEVSLLLGVTQPAWNRYEKGSRDIPEYITREIEFFQALSKKSQQLFINRLANNANEAEFGGRGVSWCFPASYRPPNQLICGVMLLERLGMMNYIKILLRLKTTFCSGCRRRKMETIKSNIFNISLEKDVDFCTASPLLPIYNVVTGEKNEQVYEMCETVNDGHCLKFKPVQGAS